MRYRTRYDRPGMGILGKQYMITKESTLQQILAIVEATEKDGADKSLRELLLEACTDAFQAGRIDGIRSERARRRKTKVEQ